MAAAVRRFSLRRNRSVELLRTKCFLERGSIELAGHGSPSLSTQSSVESLSLAPLMSLRRVDCGSIQHDTQSLNSQERSINSLAAILR